MLRICRVMSSHSLSVSERTACDVKHIANAIFLKHTSIGRVVSAIVALICTGCQEETLQNICGYQTEESSLYLTVLSVQSGDNVSSFAKMNEFSIHLKNVLGQGCGLMLQTAVQ